MKNNTLKIEWQSVETDDLDQRLLRVFEILLNNNLYEYEKSTQETI